MEARFNVYFSGEVLPGHSVENVRKKLAAVFNANQQTLDKLFSGKPQLIKRDCDQATAKKYQTAMERAGAQPIIKATEAAAPPTQPARAMTAAEKIAALAAAPDASVSQPGTASRAPAMQGTDSAPDSGSISLAPQGTAVLREEERAKTVAREVDTSALSVDATAGRLSAEPEPPSPAPDTSHLVMGEVGETIPTLPSTGTPITPNTDALDLAPVGTDYSDCKPPEPEALPLDLSALDLAPPASDLLEDKYRRSETKAAPSTDHISLQD